jgi:hypothetical protein
LGRSVVQDALGRALASLSVELEMDERLELDHDTKDEAGMAAIADTIFRKITEAGAFVGDVTSAGRSDRGRELPNPNVMIELGWAWAHLSHKNIILVANKAFGPKTPEQLPFDVRHRRAVIFYNLNKTADADAIEQATADLALALEGALRISLADWLKAVADAPGPAGRPSRVGDQSRWFDEGVMLNHQPFHGGGGLQRVALQEGRSLYVRVIPERFSGVPPTASQVHDWSGQHGKSGLQPLGPIGSGDGGLNGNGALRYALKKHADPTESWTAVQWSRDNGELWSLDTFRLRDGQFRQGTLLGELAQFLTRSLTLLRDFGAAGLIRIEVGAIGLLGTQIPGAFQHERSDALQDSVKVSQARRVWDDSAVLELLEVVSEGFADAYGREDRHPAGDHRYLIDVVRRTVSGLLS